MVKITKKKAEDFIEKRKSYSKDDIDFLENVADRIRIEAIKATTQAGSGHPTTAMSQAEINAVLRFTMRQDVTKPFHPNRDALILSKGHGVPADYAAMALAGYWRTEDVHNGLRVMGSRFEGHPTTMTHEAYTGSLGQGLSMGVGEALAAKLQESDFLTFVLMGDAECHEGNVWEAAMAASKFELNNLIAFVDRNKLAQIDWTDDEMPLEPFADKWEAFGWNVLEIDGHHVPSVIYAIERAKMSRKNPTVIIADTLKGKGVDFVEDKVGWHGKALSEKEMDKALKQLGNPDLSKRFQIPRPEHVELGERMSTEEFLQRVKGTDYSDEELATRDAFGKALVNIGKLDEAVVVVDPAVGNSTRVQDFGEKFPDRHFQVGIQEQNAIGIATGLSIRGHNVFVGSFGAFLTRCFDQIRMASYSGANLKIFGSHSGVSIGQDGPSQMGLEDLAMMRTLDECVIFSPSDAVSAGAVTKLAAAHIGMFYIRTCRPKVPVIYDNDEHFWIGGSKVLRSSDNDTITVVAHGVTVHEALKAHDILKGHGVNIRVVDAYSIQPLDVDTIRSCAHETHGNLLTVEDHRIDGGLGDAVASALGPDRNISLHQAGVNKTPGSGPELAQLRDQGLDAESIVSRVHHILNS